MRGDDDNLAGLDALYKELAPGLVRYLRRKLQHSNSLAEDIAQEAFLILVRKWPDVRNHPNPKAWLYKVARHLAIDTLKDVPGIAPARTARPAAARGTTRRTATT